MKLKVTELGVSQNGKDIEKGEVITVAGDDIPPSLVNKVVEVEGDHNDDDGKGYADMKRDELDALAAERGIDISEAKNKGDVIAALQLADETAKAA